jgi:metal-responsive CopG/Arc/MetJ family transcriptional regulator
MYTYIMHRTQIYLPDEICALLDREARRSGRSRSQLIRDAIDIVYLHRARSGEAERTLAETAGAWKNRRTSGAAYVERLRSGRLGRLHAADESK